MENRKSYMSTELNELAIALNEDGRFVEKLNKISNQAFSVSALWCLVPRLMSGRLIAYGEKKGLKEIDGRVYHIFAITVMGHHLELQVPDNGVSIINPVWFVIK